MKRCLTWAAVLLALAAALLAAAWFGRDRLLAPPIEALIREVLREETGLEVAIEAISGSYLRDVEIRGLKTVQPAATGPVASLSVQRIHLRYRLPALLQGVDRFLATASIAAEAPQLAIDLDRLADRPPEAAAGERPPALPAVLPGLQISDGRLVLSSGSLLARVEGISLASSTAAGPRLAVELTAGRLEAARRPHPGAGFAPVLAGQLRLRTQAPWPPPARGHAVDRMHLEFSGRCPADDAPVRVQAAAALHDSQLNIDRLEVAAGRSRLLVTEAGAPWEGIVAGDPWSLLATAAGSLAFTSEEIPRLLAMIGRAIPAGGPPAPEHRLALQGRLEAGVLRMAAAELIAGEAAIRVTDLETRIDPGALDSPLAANLTADVPDLGALAPIFNGPALAGRLAAEIRLSGTLGAPQGRGEVSVRELAVAGAPLGNLRLRVQAAQQEVRIESIELARGQDLFSARGVLRLPERRLEEGRVEFSLGDIGAGLRGLPVGWDIFAGWPIAGRLRGSAAIAGPWLDPDGELALEVHNLALRGRPLGSGTCRLRKKAREIAADPITLIHGADRLFLQGRFDFAAQRFGAVRLELAAAEIAPYLAAFNLATPQLSGPLRLRLEGSGPLREPDVTLEAFLGRLQSGGWTLGESRVEAAGARGRIRFERIESRTPIGKLHLSGDVAASPAAGGFTATMDRLDLSGDIPLALTRPATLHYTSAGEVTISDLDATGPHGRLAVQGTAALRGRSDLTVHLRDVSGRGWLPRLTGLPIGIEGLDATLRAAGTLSAPVISAAGALRHVQLGPGAGAGTGRFELAFSQGKLQIQTIELSAAGGNSLRLAGVLPVSPALSPALAPGPLSLQADLSLPGQEVVRALAPSWPFVAGSLHAELKVEGSWQNPNGTLHWTGRDLATADDAGWPPGPYQAAGAVALHERRLTLDALRLNGPTAALEAQGELTELAAAPDLISGRSDGRHGRVSLRAALRIDELGWAARALAGVRRSAGRIEAEALLAGTLANPELKAELRLIDGEIRTEADLPPLNHLGLEAGFGGRRLEIRSLQGEAGGALFRIAGEVGPGPSETAEAALRLEGDNLLLYRSETVTLRADTRLSLSGPLSAPTLSGTLAITDGGLSTRWRFLDTFLTPGRPASESGLRLFSLQTPPFRDMRFQVRISSKAPFRMRTNVARGQVRPDLLLAGSGESPVLTGVVYVDPGRLSLPSTTLKVESGLIRFLPSDPERPVVHLTGSARVYGYDITLRVEGPYDAPEIFLSSVPPLAHEELLWMLLTGEPPRQAAALAESQQAGMKVAVYVGRDFITHWLESALPESDETVLDRLDVEVGRSVSRSGQQTIEAQFRLAEGFIRRGEALYLVGEKDIYDTYNMGIRLVFRFQ